VDLEGERARAEKAAGNQISYLMCPKVFTDYAEHFRKYGDLSVHRRRFSSTASTKQTRRPRTSTKARHWSYASPDKR